jgi:hypothetical protein
VTITFTNALVDIQTIVIWGLHDDSTASVSRGYALDVFTSSVMPALTIPAVPADTNGDATIPISPYILGVSKIVVHITDPTLSPIAVGEIEVCEHQ